MDEAAVSEVEEGRKENVVSEDDEATINDQPSVDNNDERNEVFYCQACGDAFKEEATYLMHLQQHSQQDDGTCQEAQLNDESEVETGHKTPLHDLHSQENTPEKDSSEQMDSGMDQQRTYHCEECGKSYEMLGHFLNHQKKHRQASKSVFYDLEHLKKKSFQCEICGRSYSRASALDAHRRCHEGKLVKKCRNSPESLGSEPRLEHTKPMENHTEPENTAVEKSYKQSFEKSFECPCGKSFASLMGLKTHQRFSRNELCSPEELFEKEKKSGAFKCRQCDKTFSGYTALISHERWHSDTVHKYPCEECGKVFMTLNFYERHQRLAHSNQIASKSFLHQVCQIQKKSFECKVCGLKFSRASALHSHELQHTDVFKETRLPQSDHKYVTSEPKSSEQIEDFENLLPTDSDRDVNDTTDEDSLEPGDLIVKVISSTESEDNTEEDENSDLELVCESDQEGKEDGDLAIHQKVVSKPHMNLKIVQVDYGEPLPARAQSHNSPVEERHDCPDCYRWFNNAASLRVHRMWHGVRRRRQLAQVPHIQESEEDFSDSDFEIEMDSRGVYSCKLCGKIYLYLHAYKKHLEMHRLNGKKPRSMPTPAYCSGSKKYECPECGCSFLRRAKLIRHLKLHRMRNSNRKCDLCNKIFASDTSWIGHIKLHEQRPFWCYTCAKGFTDQEIFNKHMYLHKCRKFTCTVCNKTFMFRRQLNDHLNLHTGAKPHICTFCGKGFSHSATLNAHKKSHCKRAGFKSVWVNNKIRRINNEERQQVERTLQMLSEGKENKMTSQNIVEKSRCQDTYAPVFKPWECCDCEVCFDEVTQLHSHYMQHATGEIPMGQDL